MGSPMPVLRSPPSLLPPHPPSFLPPTHPSIHPFHKLTKPLQSARHHSKHWEWSDAEKPCLHEAYVLVSSVLVTVETGCA